MKAERCTSVLSPVLNNRRNMGFLHGGLYLQGFTVVKILNRANQLNTLTVVCRIDVRQLLIPKVVPSNNSKKQV